MERSAVLAFPGDDGEPICRMVLERINGAGDRTAAWLMCNPSTADAEQDDRTAGRVVYHSTRAGCERSLIGNVWPYRTPYPADLWAAIAAGKITAEMMRANLDALAMIGAQADIHIVAFGAEPRRRFPAVVQAAVDAFTLGGRHPTYCLGTTDDRLPLHPLARGRFAVRNDARLRPWRDPFPGEKSWAEVMSDKRLTEYGTFVSV